MQISSRVIVITDVDQSCGYYTLAYVAIRGAEEPRWWPVGELRLRYQIGTEQLRAAPPL